MSAPHKLVLDAGPLIALFNNADKAHQAAVRGFKVLQAAKTPLILPMPVLFEVYKWLLFRRGTSIARRALVRALAVLKIVPIQTEDLHDVLEVLSKQPDWNGTLEDASVAMLALRMGASVWTLDYRHLSAFKTVSFWNP